MESERKTTESPLNRDERRDPWGGAPVQDVDELPSGTSPGPQPTAGGDANPDDRRSGGDAGLVGEDDRLIDRGK